MSHTSSPSSRSHAPAWECSAAAPAAKSKWNDEIPSGSPLPTGMTPIHPGTIVQGRDPVAIASADDASKAATAQYETTAQAAQAAASLSSQAAQLQAVVGEFKLDADDAPAVPSLGHAQQPRLSAA